MTDEQKAALEWLDKRPIFSNSAAQFVPVIRAMLAEPRLPKEPTPEMRDVIGRAHEQANTGRSMYPGLDIYRALYAHLAKPATRTVEVWRVEYADSDGNPFIGGPYESELDAKRLVVELKANDFICIHVTGPHTQEVPA